jgi:hypothetical protein
MESVPTPPNHLDELLYELELTALTRMRATVVDRGNVDVDRDLSEARRSRGPWRGGG